MTRYLNCFYAQGEDAAQWLNILDHQGVDALLQTVSNGTGDFFIEEGKGEVLCSALTHEILGNFAVTYSHSLEYLGISVRKD